MDRELGIAALLGAMGISSGAISIYRWQAREKVALSLDDAGDSVVRMPSLHDSVFEIARPDDFIDGYSLNEAAFWTRMRRRKIAVTVAFMGLVWTGSIRGPAGGINSAFAVYLALMASLSVFTTNAVAHAYYTVTLAILSTTALLLLVGGVVIHGGDFSTSEMKWYRILLYLVASAFSLTMHRGPPLHFPPEKIYSAKVSDSARIHAENNVNGFTDASPFAALFFSYISKVVNLPSGFGVADLPLLTADMRAVVNFSWVRDSLRRRHAGIWQFPPGMRFGYTLLRVNAVPLVGVQVLSALTAAARYAPAYFTRRCWFISRAAPPTIARATSTLRAWWGQLWSLAHIAGVRIAGQTNTLLFLKTLVRKDIVGLSATISALVLMKAKDERMALTNEVLGGIRMIKFMAWERKFEARLWGIREKELARQKITFITKTVLTVIGNFIPLLFALASFRHYTVIRQEVLTPSIAFTAITIFNSIQYAISRFPEALLAGLQVRFARAALLVLDDILSAVDVHTAQHIYHTCIKGRLMLGRTVILVSHNIQLCAEGATYIVALDKGTTGFKGGYADFRRSSIFRSLLQTETASVSDIPTAVLQTSGALHSTSLLPQTARKSPRPAVNKGTAKPPKLIVDEASSVGRIPWNVWKAYLQSCGRWNYWCSFTIILLVASFGPVFENGYLRTWSDASEAASNRPIHYLSIYAAILCIDLISRMVHFLTLYSGSIHASRVLYKKLLETVLFSNIRFHDTIARGNLLNRFGKDFQIIDGFIADDLGRALKLGVAVVITLFMITLVGGLPFLCVAFALGLVYYFLAKDYGHTSRDMRRLVSTTTSPLYSIYETAISGVIFIRSFGASTTFLRDMMRSVDANSCASHWQYGLNCWFSVLSMTFAGTIVAVIAIIIFLSPTIDPSLAGVALVFASMVSADLMYFVRCFVGLEQCIVVVERVKETSDLVREPPEIIEPRPPTNWPSRGEITCQDLSIRYSPDLPDVLQDITFHVLPDEKSEELDPVKAHWLLRSFEEPTLMTGTLRSTLDVFDAHQDAEIFEALFRVHLISDDTVGSVFNNLDSPVSQAGENFSAGVDYATDELIGVTLRQQVSFALIGIHQADVFIIDYDKVMVLEEGHTVEFERSGICGTRPCLADS
ncbi:hypothetical protein C8R44DRAFT_889121 [Mycena epipterygia]|nr:hypothetical protein C8R44DRAFT_889121 [Mycena epipterygia]